MTALGCGKNQLTSLDVSKNTELTELYCHSNQLTSLDISKNTELTELSCANNQFSEEEMNKIYEALPYVGYDNDGKPKGTLKCDKLGNWFIAQQKGWGVSFE